jgi:hypothetical protein
MSYLGKHPSITVLPDIDSGDFTGDGSATVFTLPQAGGNDASVIVSIDGVRQHLSTYTISGTSLTFNTAPPSGAAIEAILLGIETQIGVPDPNTVGILQLNVNDGTNGQALMTNGSGTLNFGAPYTHPTTAGNKHIPTGGAANQHLKYDASGTAVWADVPLELPSQGSNTDKFLKTDGSNPAWADVPAGSPVGNGTNKVFYENDQNVTGSYTLTANKNAMTAAPVTINSGVTVTIPSGARWVIV